jgi:phospholipid/cholesterol/gamma-HCH transport system permease protein
MQAIAWYLLRRDVPVQRVLHAAYQSITGSFILVCAAVGFVGASLCWQGAWQARRVVGDQSFIGPEYLLLIVTEFGPLMTGCMLAARGGAGLAAQLATRKATFQTDALTLLGDDPIRVFVVPHIAAALIASAVLTPPALLAGELAGIITMKTAFQVEPATFVALDGLHAGDLLFSLLKTVVFGVAVTFMGARAGLSAQPHPSGVGQAATRGVVDGSLAVLSLDAVMDALRFVTGFP